MKYLLKTTYPCLIKIANETFELEGFDALEIEDEDYLFVYPQKKLCPFYINLKNPIENEHFSILKHEKKTFLILEQEKNFCSQVKNKFVISGKTCFVSTDENSVSFETETRKTSAKILALNDCQISSINNFIIAKFEKEIFAFDLATEKLSHFSGDKISINKNTIKVEQTFSPEHKSKVSTYEIAQTITPIETSFSETEDGYNFFELLPLNFLRCVKSKDYQCAMNSLSQNLKEQITEKNLGDFFGNFNSILPLNTLEFITISSDKKNFVKFSIKDDKVEDILIDEL